MPVCRTSGVNRRRTVLTATVLAVSLLSTSTAKADSHYPYEDPANCPKEAPYRVSETTCSSDPNYKPSDGPGQAAPKGDTSNITTTEGFRGAFPQTLSASLTSRYYTGGSPTLFLASSETYPDAISATPLIGQSSGALYLYGQGEGKGIGQQELQRLGVRHVVILGGYAAVTKYAEEDIRTSDSSITTERVAGRDRYETAALASKKAFTSGGNTVYLASGQNFPDALSAGAAGAAAKAPVLLSDPKVLPSVTLQAIRDLGARNVVIIGGTVAVNDDVFRKLQREGFSVRRVAGADRYLTAVEVAKQLFASPTRALIADGNSFQAALIASAPAAKIGTPLLLKTPTCTPVAVQQYVNSSGYTEVNGAAVIPDSAQYTGVRHGC